MSALLEQQYRDGETSKILVACHDNILTWKGVERWSARNTAVVRNVHINTPEKKREKKAGLQRHSLTFGHFAENARVFSSFQNCHRCQDAEVLNADEDPKIGN